MKKGSSLPLGTVVVVAAMIMMILLAKTPEAVTCNPSALSPCLPAITTSAKPTPTCCSSLKAQKPCFCGYLKNPSLKQYINSPGAKKVVSACGVGFPSC